MYHDIRSKGIVDDFYKQLEKMKFQDHHKYKSVKETWEYAYKKLINSKSSEFKSKNPI
jgi:hypothetical protein